MSAQNNSFLFPQQQKDGTDGPAANSFAIHTNLNTALDSRLELYILNVGLKKSKFRNCYIVRKKINIQEICG